MPVGRMLADPARAPLGIAPAVQSTSARSMPREERRSRQVLSALVMRLSTRFSEMPSAAAISLRGLPCTCAITKTLRRFGRNSLITLDKCLNDLIRHRLPVRTHAMVGHLLHPRRTHDHGVLETPAPQVHEREIRGHLEEHGARKQHLLRPIHPVQLLEGVLRHLARHLPPTQHLGEVGQQLRLMRTAQPLHELVCPPRGEALDLAHVALFQSLSLYPLKMRRWPEAPLPREGKAFYANSASRRNGHRGTCRLYPTGEAPARRSSRPVLVTNSW